MAPTKPPTRRTRSSKPLAHQHPAGLRPSLRSGSRSRHPSPRRIGARHGDDRTFIAVSGRARAARLDQTDVHRAPRSLRARKTLAASVNARRGSARHNRRAPAEMLEVPSRRFSNTARPSRLLTAPNIVPSTSTTTRTEFYPGANRSLLEGVFVNWELSETLAEMEHTLALPSAASVGGSANRVDAFLDERR
jgi:hypothetical protein